MEGGLGGAGVGLVLRYCVDFYIPLPSCHVKDVSTDP